MANYLVLIADIEASREIQNNQRDELQEQLQAVLDTINEKGEGLVSPYTITLGDEFQAVYDEAHYLFVHIMKILGALHPVAIRFSLGIGTISTPINSEQAIGMDGPAFHEARKGMETLKKNGFLFNIRVEDEENPVLDAINGSLQLISGQMRGWNKKRFEILHMLKEGYDYKAIADELDISRTAFYKNREAGLLDVISDLCDSLAKIMNKKLQR